MTGGGGRRRADSLPRRLVPPGDGGTGGAPSADWKTCDSSETRSMRIVPLLVVCSDAAMLRIEGVDRT
jgi:hypothetical protein